MRRCRMPCVARCGHQPDAGRNPPPDRWPGAYVLAKKRLAAARDRVTELRCGRRTGKPIAKGDPIGNLSGATGFTDRVVWMVGFLKWIRLLLGQPVSTSSPFIAEAAAAKAGWRTGAERAPAAGSAQIPSLDGIRAVSIAIVFLAHSGASDLIPGGFGVTVFFFLSGFLITTLLAREQDRHGAISLRAFYLRRVLRLLPPVLIVLAAATALVLGGLVEGDLSIPTFLSQIFFYYNYHAQMPGVGTSVNGLGILWSLSVEEHFYLVWPVLFIAIARGWIGIGGVLVLLAGILAWRYVRMAVLGADEWTLYISTDTRFDSLLYGCLLALMVWRGHAARVFPQAFAARAILIGGALVVLLATFVIRDDAFRSTFRYTVQGIALMPLFYYAVHRPRDLVFRPLNWAPLRMVGLWSYTIYLCHFVIIEALVHTGFGQIGDARLIGLSAVLSCGFAALVYHVVEQPMKPLRAQLSGH